MPLVLVVKTHLHCIFLRVRGLHIQFIDRVVDILVYDYELADPVSSRKYSVSDCVHSSTCGAHRDDVVHSPFG